MHLLSLVSLFMSGFRVPVKEFLDNFNEIKSSQVSEKKGIPPESSLLETSNVSNLVLLHKASSMKFPFSLLLFNFRFCNDSSDAISDGRLPTKLLEAIIIKNLGLEANIEEANIYMIINLPKETLTTIVSLLQSTPCHAHSKESVKCLSLFVHFEPSVEKYSTAST